MAARECHTAALLIGVLLVLLPSPARGDASGCPTAVQTAVGQLADDVTGPIRARFCPSSVRVVLRMAPPGGEPLDVEAELGGDTGFRSAGAFMLSPVLNAEWEAVPAPQVHAFDALTDTLSARGGDLVRALTSPPESAPPGFLPEVAPLAPPPAAVPWLPLVALVLLLVAAPRARPSTLPGIKALALLFVAALALRVTLGLWGPLHVNGQGPLWLLGAWGRPDLLATYGPGYPEIFTWIARLVPGSPDRAVFATNALLSAAVAPAAVWLAAGLGVPTVVALLAGVVLACDPITVLGAASESYYPAILLACVLAGGATLAGSHSDDRRWQVLLALAAGLLLAQAARIHPLAWPLVAVTPTVALGRGPAGVRSAALTGLAAAVVAALHAPGLLAVGYHLVAEAGDGPVSARNLRPLGAGFWIAVVYALVAARRVGLPAWTLVVAAIPFVAVDAATHRIFGQSALWHASYRHVVLAIPAVCAVGLVPERWVGAGRRAAVVILGVGAVVLALGAPSYGDRTTEQQEYAFLQGALRTLPEGCRVAYVDRAERRILTLPEHLIPGWNCGTTAGIRVRSPDDVAAGLLPTTCRAWYRGSLCASAEGRALCDAAEAGVELEEIAGTSLPARPSYADLPYDVDPVPVTLSKVVAARRTGPLDGVRVAITVDDLPWVGPAPPDGRVGGTKRLLAALDGVPATGFVNCGAAASAREIIDLWVEAGQALGNHQERHDDIDKVGLDRWTEGARACHATLSDWLGTPPETFRYPYLRNGKERSVRDAARAVITEELGESIGRVTADTHEWKLAQLYGQALDAGDQARADAIAALYPEHLAQSLIHAVTVARAKVGRDVDHVFLLHANRLAADHLAGALAALRDQGVVFVPLVTALADPVYAREDAYVGPGGISWLYRIAPVTPPEDWTFENRAWEEIEALLSGR